MEMRGSQASVLYHGLLPVAKLARGLANPLTILTENHQKLSTSKQLSHKDLQTKFVARAQLALFMIELNKDFKIQTSGYPSSRSCNGWCFSAQRNASLYIKNSDEGSNAEQPLALGTLAKATKYSGSNEIEDLESKLAEIIKSDLYILSKNDLESPQRAIVKRSLSLSMDSFAKTMDIIIDYDNEHAILELPTRAFAFDLIDWLCDYNL